MPSALVILAEGAEEMETVICVDVMRRGGIDVTVAGLHGDGNVTCSRGVKLVPDISLQNISDKIFDVIVCPGGAQGAKNLAESEVVGTLLKNQQDSGRYLAAVCAAPIALEKHRVAVGKNVTSHPSVKETMSKDYKYSEDRVVSDGKLITSRGPGTCFEFALAIVEALVGKEKRDSLIPPMLLKL